ncbi:YceD family protein [Bradyrhizobium sp. BR 1432]|uniref:YceD family protein n=1 Tax=Bradyrhizobium sp. BR 1432 TaxID=3447966 RepID=UPI003EE6E774
MSRPTTGSQPDPWRAPVIVAQVPDTGLHRELEASAAERQAMAAIAGLREILSARASFDIVPKSGGRVQVTGLVRGRIGQTCVVTLDPIESEIEEEVDLMFAPEAEARRLADLIEEGQDDQEPPDVADPPEAVVNGIIDLGRLATDALFLAIDPYPRKEGAVFEAEVTAPDPEDHPFAALKALQDRKRANSSAFPAGPLGAGHEPFAAMV